MVGLIEPHYTDFGMPGGDVDLTQATGHNLSLFVSKNKVILMGHHVVTAVGNAFRGFYLNTPPGLLCNLHVACDSTTAATLHHDVTADSIGTINSAATADIVSYDEAFRTSNGIYLCVGIAGTTVGDVLNCRFVMEFHDFYNAAIKSIDDYLFNSALGTNIADVVGRDEFMKLGNFWLKNPSLFTTWGSIISSAVKNAVGLDVVFQPRRPATVPGKYYESIASLFNPEVWNTALPLDEGPIDRPSIRFACLAYYALLAKLYA
jgi:hypothetical protein